MRTHTHTHSDWENLDSLMNLMCSCLGCGRKPEHPEKTHTDTRRKCKLHIDRGSGQESTFSPHQRHNGMTLKDTMLFEDLLYFTNQGIFKFKQWVKVTNTVLLKGNTLFTYTCIKTSKIRTFSSAILSTFYAVSVNYKAMISSCLKEQRRDSEKTEAYRVDTRLEVP